MDRRGQTLVEYAILLTVFTGLAVVGVRYVFPAMGQLYHSVSTHRGGIQS